MRVIIYGAGGIGGVVGGHLARAGHDVVLIGRRGPRTSHQRVWLPACYPYWYSYLTIAGSY